MSKSYRMEEKNNLRNFSIRRISVYLENIL